MLPDMSNPFNIQPRTICGITLGVFCDWDEPLPPFYTFDSENIHTFIVLHDSETGRSLHATVDLEHVRERLVELDEERNPGDALTLKEAEEISLSVLTIIATLRQTVAVTNEARVINPEGVEIKWTPIVRLRA